MCGGEGREDGVEEGSGEALVRQHRHPSRVYTVRLWIYTFRLICTVRLRNAPSIYGCILSVYGCVELQGYRVVTGSEEEGAVEDERAHRVFSPVLRIRLVTGHAGGRVRVGGRGQEEPQAVVLCRI